MKRLLRFVALALLVSVSLAPSGFSQPTPTPTATASDAKPTDQPLRFEVTFPASARATPATGRLLLFFAQGSTTEPRQVNYSKLAPVYAIDVKDLTPATAFLPANFTAPEALAFPTALGRLPPGTYQVQALLDLDPTERDYNAGPGNLYSRPQTCTINGTRGGTFTLALDQVIKPATPPADTEWVKFVDLPSKLLTDFHGRPTYLRAGVILPSTYTTEPNRRYPVVYVIPGYGGRHTSPWTWITSAVGQRWQKANARPQTPRQTPRAHRHLRHFLPQPRRRTPR